MSEMADAIRELQAQRGMSEDSIRQTIENAIKAAYKRTYGNADNCIVQFNEDMTDIVVYARKTILDGVWDPSQEIELEEAIKLSEECKVGDEIDIPIDPRDFARSAVSTGKQTAHQALNENLKKSLENEYKDKVGQTIIGYCRRLVPDKKGDKGGFNYYIDVGKNDSVEGFLPAKYQSPRETYSKDERIRALIKQIKPTASGIQLVLSRSDPDFVKNLVELEIPEIADKTVIIHKVVREAGYRTKIAVSSTKSDVDPVGACVGQKGQRIQAIIKEIEGEKIDVLKYDPDPRVFIQNALSPAEVKKVIIIDSDKRSALAVVGDNQFSLAIGKSGLNVRLANKLCDWNIDVKTEAEAAELNLSELDSRRAAEQLFSNVGEDVDISTISQLPGVDQRIAAMLKEAALDDIQDFVDAAEGGTVLEAVPGITQKDIDAINAIINEYVVFEEEDAAEGGDEAAGQTDEEEYRCPTCGAQITLSMTRCPKCGAELEFKFEEEEGK